jgi:alpha-ketoglutarate-dependent taurine dioxygenase
MLTHTVEVPRAWGADTIDHSDTWYYALPERVLSPLHAMVRERRRATQPITDLRIADDMRAAARTDLDTILTALEAGRGFVVFTFEPPADFALQDRQALYWLVGQLLGEPVVQNVQGTLLYDVRDTGQDVRYGARFSVTSAESTFHTDNSFGTQVVDYVGLLCLNPAQSGGQSQLVSGHTVWQELRDKHRDALELLRQPFHFDRRGGLRPGDDPTIRFPIFAGDGPELLIRYLRYWIEVGHEKAQLPLTAEQVNALNLLDRVAEERSLRVEFAMRPGEMLFVNNRWILHNRTAFVDYAEPERKRHYVRLWLQRPGRAAVSYR